MPDLPRHYASARSSLLSELQAAARDMMGAFRMTQLWYALGTNDIVSRYRGSILGPFWITLTTAVFVAGIGLVYAKLMHVSLDNYLPWLATGVVVWGFINQSIQESADAFIAASAALRQTSIPLAVFIWRVIWRNLLTLVHQAPVLLGVALVFHYLTRINLPMAVVGVALVVANISWISLCAAIICARFRDVQQILVSVMQLLFFVTPVLWMPTGERAFRIIATFNPAAHMLNVVRAPLLGMPMSLLSVAVLVALALIGWTFSFLFFALIRRRVVHYI